MLRQRSARVSASTRLRQWRDVTGSHAASDSAHYPQSIKKLTSAFGVISPRDEPPLAHHTVQPRNAVRSSARSSTGVV